MNSPLVTSRISWSAISEEVFRKTGRVYSGSYLREIATGWRKHSKLMPLLEELGVVSEKSPLLAKAAAFICDNNSAEERLLRHRRILAGHLREAIIANHVLRAEMRASQIRAGEVASEMMNEISSHRTDMLIKNMEIKKITAERDALELERNELKARLFESNRSRERMVNDIERLSKAANRRRITHIRLGNELFRNRTKEHV